MSLNQSELNSVLMLKKILIGAEVVDLKIGFSTTLEVLNGKEQLLISIGNSEIVIDDKIYCLDVYDIHSKVILANFFKSKINSLEVDENGSLITGFDNNSKKILTKFGSNYEAWEINGPKGFQVICMPGGQLASFRGCS